MVVVLVCAALSGCAKPKVLETQGPKQPTTLETIGKLEAISNVLGCMFDPTHCQRQSKENQSLPKEIE